MALSIIGAGLGRTGTLSLKRALEILGFDPCYHMVEVFPYPERASAWVATMSQVKPNWDKLFDGFRATVDWPGVAYWRQLVEHYPDAKVILTLRDPVRWFDSARATIFNVEALGNLPPPLPSMDVSPLVYRMFDNRVTDRDHCMEVFNRHNREVVDSVPSERLLQFQVGDGWAPLCAFLGCEVPDESFPHVNESESFIDMVRDRSSSGDLTPPL